MSACIYAITHAATGRQYVGSAVNRIRRWRQHKSALSLGCHDNSRLQNGWNKHGAEAYTFSILEAVLHPANLIEREQFWIDKTDPFYNILLVAGSSLGLKHSDSSCDKMSAAHKTRPPHSAETRAKIAASNTGKKRSDEARQKMSLAWKSRAPCTGAARANMSAGWKKRPPVSDETRQKMSLAMKGRTFSEDHRAKLSAARKVRKGGQVVIRITGGPQA